MREKNIKVTVIPIVDGILGIIPKNLEKREDELDISGRIETILMTALIKSVRILWRILEIWGDLQSFKLLWKPPLTPRAKKLTKCKIIIMIIFVKLIWFQILSNTNNLHTVIWFQAFLSKTNNLHTYIVSSIPI